MSIKPITTEHNSHAYCLLYILVDGQTDTHTQISETLISNLFKMETFGSYTRVRVPGDRKCLFQSLALLLEADESQHTALRKRVELVLGICASGKLITMSTIPGSLLKLQWTLRY
jgi:hypothetical protein